MAALDVSKINHEGRRETSSPFILHQGSRIAVIGGGPAGSFFSYFLLDMAERIDLKVHLDIFEPRNFKEVGPGGCNMCGGVIYESLIQNLAVEGINLPTDVVQRGIEYNKLHLDIGSTLIQTPHHEKRIATTFRGAGPKDLMEVNPSGLDDFLFEAAISRGAHHISDRVRSVAWEEISEVDSLDHRRLQIKTKKSEIQIYDFLVVSAGVNSSLLNNFKDLEIGYEPPSRTRLLVREYHLGEEIVSRYLGPGFHAFLLDIPGLDYGAIIPKGKYITVCLLSSSGDLDREVMETFLADPAVKSLLPPDFSAASSSCSCSPAINAMGCKRPFSDRIVFIGDSGVSRLYKDGIGAAYRTAKVAASTAVFQGISRRDFEEYYQPLCKKITADNRIGKMIFGIISQVQNFQFARRAVLRMVSIEQQGKANAERGLSTLMWDMLTGGAAYKEVLIRALHPEFIFRFLWNLVVSLLPANEKRPYWEMKPSSLPQTTPELIMEGEEMDLGALGKVYQNGEVIVRQGESGDCMYVVQDGLVEVVFESDEDVVQLNVLGKDEFFGEMAIFNQELRTATVRALGPARILTVNHKNLLKCIHEDPSLAYRLMQVMSDRIDRLSEAVSDLSKSPGD